MTPRLMPFFLLCAFAASAVAQSPVAPTVAPAAALPAPRDIAYPGLMTLAVDATDLDRRVVRVHETLTGVAPGQVLYFPQWLPGHHAPSGPIDRLSGLTITADGRPVPWQRDPVNVYAFHVLTDASVQKLALDFEYLSPTGSDVGGPEIGRDVLFLEWNDLLLYPAGYYVRRIPVEAGVTLPTGWEAGTALEPVKPGSTTFKRTSLETLVDSPVYAGRYVARFDLDPGAAVPVRLNVFADLPELLALTPQGLAAYRALVQQAYRLFGSHHFDHYDFLYSLSEQVAHNGLEHHQSSEDGGDPQSFTDWERTANQRDLLPHEFTHSWNGKFRRPADLWTPSYDVPMQGSLLWVYEGQTQYWGHVLAARAGLRTRQQTLDAFAMTAAYYQAAMGKQWRPVQDTTEDPVMNPWRKPQTWRDRQRFEDYYEVGQLIWLDVDTLIRERSAGKRSLDDFARAFFGVGNGSFVPATYTFDDVVTALNAVEPYDWAAFLRARLDGVGMPAPLDGLARGGYRLVFTGTASDYQRIADAEAKRLNLFYSIGAVIDTGDRPGSILQVLWDSPVFKAGLARGAQILAVNGYAYSAERLRSAIQAAGRGGPDVELVTRLGDVFRVVKLDYHGGLRYPHLQRDASAPARLDDILAARSK